MTAAVSQAVILAAGMGTRLSHSTAYNRPKGFLEIGDQTLIQQSLQKLRRAGIDKVTIITGHCKRWYESLADMSNGFVTTVHNPHYDRSGSMYSLYCARHALPCDFLLLESDLIYEQRAVEALLHSDYEDCILLSGLSESHDEVFVETTGGKLRRMSKNRDELASVSGEFVGITRISAALFRDMVSAASVRFEESLHVDYETDCLVDVAAHRDIPCHTVFDLAWAEIDDIGHLQRARNAVYPEILRRDGAGIAPDRTGTSGR